MTAAVEVEAPKAVVEAPALGLHSDLTNEDYHADKTSLSSSGARKLLPPSCPAKFRYEQDNPPAPTKTFDYGNAAHKLVLGNGPDLVLVDHDAWTTKTAKAEVTEARARDGIPLKQHEMDMVNAMAAAIRRHPLASALLDPAYGAPEQSGFWIDEASGIRRRVRFDWLPSTHSGRLIIPDYKTAADASNRVMEKEIEKYGYNCQADWTQDAATIKTNINPTELFAKLSWVDCIQPATEPMRGDVSRNGTYTDDDIRETAAEFKASNYNALEVLVAMSQRVPWMGLDTEAFNEAHDRIAALADAA